MKLRSIGLLAAMASITGGAMARMPADPRPTIAFTFDDIPVHGALPPGMTREQVVRRIAATLEAERVPAFGFLNAGIGGDDPSAVRAITAWQQAGLPLGNHGYTHANLDQMGAAAFAADFDRNDARLKAISKPGADWRWFRFPFLAEGATPAVRLAARTVLRTRGYRIAAVTMGFSDWAWNTPYAACVAKNDRSAVEQLEEGFLTDAKAAALAARTGARTQIGRDIPYVLLMHVGALEAKMLPRLIALYRSMGFRFTTLPAAQSDPFYAPANDLTLPGPTRMLADQPYFAGPPAQRCAPTAIPAPASSG